ncbi:sugar phosphate isomerase/epimerase family protein [Dysosmobacter sp.]
MKLSVATGVYQRRGDSPIHRDVHEVLTALSQIGYDTFDLSLAAVDQPNFILLGDDWERQVEALGNTAANLGVSFFQSHLPFVPGCSIQKCPAFRKAGYAEFFFESTRRAYLANHMLGIKWTVLHPLTFPEYNYESQASLEGNHARYGRYIDLGIQLGVGTAIENMVPSLERRLGTVYCQHYEQLIQLTDSFDDPLVGICWDTGHANLMQLDQERALKAIGGRLKVLHINDNHAAFLDEHLLPYMGNTDWDSLIRGLLAIGYDGALSYETGNVSANAYGSLQLEYIKMMYQNGLYLLGKHEALRQSALSGENTPRAPQ